MEITKKIVTEIPLTQLWTPQRVLEAERVAYLTRQDIKQLLKVQSVTFVVANVGEPLRWINPADCYSFWQNEVESHIADNVEHIDVDSFPEEYVYVASKWNNSGQIPIVLLEKFH
jgi:hypothetical protein